MTIVIILFMVAKIKFFLQFSKIISNFVGLKLLYMRKLLLVLVLLFASMASYAQLEVKKGSFKEVVGFVNIDPDKQTDDNDKPYAVLKVRTENINDKQRRELKFQGDAQTFFEIEYRDGEVWLYLSYYATFLKISHPDLSSTEFYFPFDMKPKKGYELTLVNLSESNINEEKIMSRIEELENVTKAVAEKQAEATKPEVEKVDKSYSFLTLNISYNNYGKTAYGLSIGSMKNMGWFISAMSNFDFKGLSTDFDCGNDFLVNGHYPEYTGKVSYTSLSAIGGVMFRITEPLALRVGVGYGMKAMCYEMIDGKYVKNTDVSTSGIDVSVGAQYKLNKLIVSFDIVTTNFKYFEAKLGFGVGY